MKTGKVRVCHRLLPVLHHFSKQISDKINS